MLQSVKKLLGKRLEASDGEIGHVKEFYFDDENWVVRYLVVETGTWLFGRQVLLIPHVFGELRTVGDFIPVNLTKKQIEDSPSIETHKTVTRQHEEEYYKYYGWPNYWQGDGLWGMSNFPSMELPATPIPIPVEAIQDPLAKREDAHLRGTRAVSGYHVQAADGSAGHICDFIMDTKSWAIAWLAVKTGHRLSGNEVLIAPTFVARVSYEESTVFVNMTQDAIEISPEYDKRVAAMADESC